MSKVIKYQENEIGFTENQVNIIKSMIASNLDDDELKVFLYNAKRAGLDPLRRQIYAIKRGGKMTIQTSIDGFRIIAERTGRYAPGRSTEYMFNDKGHLISATAFVKKMTADGTWHEISEIAYLKEYFGNTPLWKSMPSVMLAKVAEARALRRAFPDCMCGIYTDDEMSQASQAQEFKEEVVFIDENEMEYLASLLDQDSQIAQEVMSRLREKHKIEEISLIPKKMFDPIVQYINKALEESRFEEESEEGLEVEHG